MYSIPGLYCTMEDSYASLVSNFIMDPDRLSDDDLDDVELDDEEEEEEEEVDDDFYDCKYLIYIKSLR